MLAIQSSIAKYHCLYIQGVVAFQTPDVFLTHPVYDVLNVKKHICSSVRDHIDNSAFKKNKKPIKKLLVQY